jgi:GMP synthase (glutamine-hydrolysing)
MATPAYAEELREADLPHSAQTIHTHSETHAEQLRERAEPLFNRFLDLIGRPARRTVLPSR